MPTLELVVRCQLRYLADVLAGLRRQPGRGFIDATGPPEHVSKNNTRFSTHGLLIAERLNVATIATLNRRDFTVVRPRHVQALTLLPE